jgi:histidinol-phosphatase (PHP family)
MGPMIDCHVHLWRHEAPAMTPSLDDFAHLVSKAASAGVDRVVIAEHLYRFRQTKGIFERWWGVDNNERLRLATASVVHKERTADLDAYVAAILQAQAAGLPVSLGLELDYFPGAENTLRAFLAPYPFDVILGSVHWIGAWLFDAYDHPTFAAEWRRREVADAWHEYAVAFEGLCQSGLCDVVAHCDLIKVAGFIPTNRSDWEDRMVAVIAGAGVTVEVSSGGLRKEIGEIYPSPRLLDRLLMRDVAVVLSSDAHFSAQIGYHFTELVSILRRHSVVSLAQFSRRERSMVPMR